MDKENKAQITKQLFNIIHFGTKYYVKTTVHPGIT